ncbi:hypothetical protein HDV06_003398 [Boothiomyces sp. JEL0866]|nr:hypothetical protein HDV06_003350 [Boothiomyces sp. JEL0866]KAJ3325628.1 hypothetical protein HDV06_003398 [Boothiomyces sp. JEL0866]
MILKFLRYSPRLTSRLTIRLYSNAINLKKLQQQYESKTEVEAVKLDLPENISEPFFLKQNEFRNNLIQKQKQFDILLEMSRLASTLEEQTNFKTSLVLWKKEFDLSESESSQIIKVLNEKNQHQLLFELLADRYNFGLIPSDLVIKNLLINSTGEQLYKNFALLLYYDIPPQIEHYEILIRKGADGNGQETEWALTTLKEYESLGWKTTPSIEFSIGLIELKKSNFDKVLLTDSDYLKTKALIGLGKIKEAILQFEKAVESEDKARVNELKTQLEAVVKNNIENEKLFKEIKY